MYTEDQGRETTKCVAMQSGKSSAGRVVLQTWRPFLLDSGRIKTDDVNDVRQKLEDQYAPAVEEVLCAEKVDRRSQVRNPNSQVGMEVPKKCSRKRVLSHEISGVKGKGKNNCNIFRTGWIFSSECSIFGTGDLKNDAKIK